MEIDDDTGLPLLECNFCHGTDLVIISPCWHRSVHHVLLEKNSGTIRAYNNDSSYRHSSENDVKVIHCNGCDKDEPLFMKVEWEWID